MNSTRRMTLTGVGVVVALAGFEHGLGELLQGWVSPPSLVIQSWPESEFFSSLSGEPAMTVIPNLAVSGIATMALSVGFLVWMTRFADRRASAAVIAALSATLLVVGGGFGPPFLGFILAIAALKVNSPLHWWRTNSPAWVKSALATIWPLLFGACIFTWLAMLFGVAALAYFYGLDNVALTLGVLLAAVILLSLALVSSLARDAQLMASAHAEPRS